MNRQEIYLIDEKPVSKETWEEAYNDPENIKTLTVKYSVSKEEYLEKQINELIERVDELERENMRLKFHQYPNISWPNINEPIKTPWPGIDPIVYCHDSVSTNQTSIQG